MLIYEMMNMMKCFCPGVYGVFIILDRFDSLIVLIVRQFSRAEKLPSLSKLNFMLT